MPYICVRLVIGGESAALTSLTVRSRLLPANSLLPLRDPAFFPANSSDLRRKTSAASSFLNCSVTNCKYPKRRLWNSANATQCGQMWRQLHVNLYPFAAWQWTWYRVGPSQTDVNFGAVGQGVKTRIRAGPTENTFRTPSFYFQKLFHPEKCLHPIRIHSLYNAPQTNQQQSNCADKRTCVNDEMNFFSSVIILLCELSLNNCQEINNERLRAN